jgi:hypothetical protein
MRRRTTVNDIGLSWVFTSFSNSMMNDLLPCCPPGFSFSRRMAPHSLLVQVPEMFYLLEEVSNLVFPHIGGEV